MERTNSLLIVVLTLVFVVSGLPLSHVNAQVQNVKPMADAGLPRYAAKDPVQLDGTGSYDPDDSSPLSYSWQQISGPAVVITDANTATPLIAGSMQSRRGGTPIFGVFTQTDEIQECEFELVVSDGELTSVPDTVKVIIVPDFGQNFVRHVNPPFDPNIPTLIFFGGGDCVAGNIRWQPSENSIKDRTWNKIEFHDGFMPDERSDANWRTYYGCGDMIIVYLSSVAPDYKMPIQTVGMSTGGLPAVDAGIRLNLTYRDARYAVNRVTLEDATTWCRGFQGYSESIAAFVASSVDGEQCWLDNYVSFNADFYPNVLNVGFEQVSHPLAWQWYDSTVTNAELSKFNSGVVAGAYWSVKGPGKNLQLASTPDLEIYKFKWYGWSSSGYMDFYDEPNHPGRLPEPVILVGPENGAFIDDHGAVFSCEESENAVGYQLLFGPDSYHMIYLFSDTPFPPNEVVNFFPFEQTWWTIKAYDRYGSTIYADPHFVNAESTRTQLIKNVVTGEDYVSIQQAINDAHMGDEIILSPGIYQYQENINFKGKNLTLRSIDPDDPDVVAGTIINGGYHGPAINLSDSPNAACELAGITIIDGTVSISCYDASPVISNCVIGSNESCAIEFLYGFEPTIIDCNILGNIKEVYDPSLVAFWKLDEIEGSLAYDSVYINDGILNGGPIWKPTGGKVAGALEFDGIDDYISTDFVLNPGLGSFSAFTWIKSSASEKVIISQNGGVDWLLADSEGKLMTKLRRGSSASNLESESIIIDGDWHHIGVVRDGSHRLLYVDGTEVTEDASVAYMMASDGGLHIGAGKDLDATSFFSGMIDDVRIYDVALSAEKVKALAQ